MHRPALLRVWHTVTATLILMLAGVGCKRATPVEIGIREQVFHLGNGSEPRDLDPHTAVSTTESNILSTLFESLVNYAPDAKTILPGAAERWDISPDGRMYTFHLRPGLKWSNGDALTSADFLYSFRRLIEPQLGAELAIYGDWVVGGQNYRTGKTHDFDAVGFRAPDPLTFKIQLRERAPYFLGMLAENPFCPVHRPTIEKYNDYLRRDGAWTRPGNLVGNGPFRLKAWRVNEAVVVEKNPNYWDSANVRLKEIHFHPINDLDVEERAFRGGLLHATRYLPVIKLPAYRKDQPALVHTDPLIHTKYIDFNVARPPFNDVRVRRAFVLAVDREAIIANVMRDGSRLADCLTLPGSGGYTSRIRVEYDPERARRALAEAGFPGGAGFPVVTLVFAPAHQGEQMLVEALQAMWQRELGVHVALSAQEEKVWLDTMRTKNFQLVMDGWSSGINDPVDLFQLFFGNSPNNNTGWASAAYDAEFAAAGQAPDDAARDAHLQAMDAVLLDELPLNPLYHNSQNYLVHPSVRGWQDNMLGWHLFNRVYLESPAEVARK